MFVGASELQLDCLVEEGGGNGTMKHGGLLSLADLSQPDDLPAPPHNGLPPTDMRSPLPGEPSDIKPDLSAGDAPAGSGERKTA